jgi:hypothetical protein
MSNTFTIRNSQDNIVAVINEREKNTTATSLVLHGRGYDLDYGFDRDQNLVFLMENFSNATPPSNPINGQLWWKTGDQFFLYDDTFGSPWTLLVPPPTGVGFNIVAGDGLVGGGLPTGSPLTTTLNIPGSASITVTADAVSVNPAGVDHDALSGFVANEHIDHSGVTIDGAGMTGGGDLTASRTLNIGAGTGITVNADTIEVSGAVVRTSGSQTINGLKTFSDQIKSADGSAGAPGFSFTGRTSNGIYRSASNELSFSTNGTQRFRIESNGVLRSTTAAATYEANVTEDDDIPNKLYVDNATGGGIPTSNTFTGTSSISGLTIGKKYLVSVYGVTINKGNGIATLGQVRLTQGTTPGSGTLIAATGTVSINWHDGQAPHTASFVVTAPNTTMAAATDYTSAFSFLSARQMVAVQLD